MDERQQDGTQAEETAGTEAPVGFAERAHLPFPVVGIGASAGGIEALQAFFDGTSPDSGMAFIVVQHLSPEHQSLMAEILARHTTMPVHQIKDGMPVQPNCVYVIAPGYMLTIAGGHLHLGAPVERRMSAGTCARTARSSGRAACWRACWDRREHCRAS